jgi:hypothetical protein
VEFLILTFTLIFASMFWELKARGVGTLIFVVGTIVTGGIVWLARLLRRDTDEDYFEVH